MNLYEVEESLQLLVEAREDVIPDQLRELEHDTAIALERSREKRDAIGRYRFHLQNRLVLIKEETDRLTALKAQTERSIERLDRYVLLVMESLQVKKLEGNLLTLCAKKNPDKVEILDAGGLPAFVMTAEIKMRLDNWKELEESLTPDQHSMLDTSISSFELKPLLAVINSALKAGYTIDGAKLSPNGNHLEVR